MAIVKERKYDKLVACDKCGRQERSVKYNSLPDGWCRVKFVIIRARPCDHKTGDRDACDLCPVCTSRIKYMLGMQQ